MWSWTSFVFFSQEHLLLNFAPFCLSMINYLYTVHLQNALQKVAELDEKVDAVVRQGSQLGPISVYRVCRCVSPQTNSTSSNCVYVLVMLLRKHFLAIIILKNESTATLSRTTAVSSWLQSQKQFYIALEREPNKFVRLSEKLKTRICTPVELMASICLFLDVPPNILFVRQERGQE